MQRKRIKRADRLQPPMRRAAVAHVILGVDLEEADVRALGQDRVEVFGLQADAGARGQRRGDAGRSGSGDRHEHSSIRAFVDVFAPGPPHVTRRARRTRRDNFPFLVAATVTIV